MAVSAGAARCIEHNRERAKNIDINRLNVFNETVKNLEKLRNTISTNRELIESGMEEINISNVTKSKTHFA